MASEPFNASKEILVILNNCKFQIQLVFFQLQTNEYLRICLLFSVVRTKEKDSRCNQML